METRHVPTAFCIGKELSPRCAQIVAAALGLLADGGIAALTIKNLAQAVGVSEPALYRHFENKQGILIAILDHLEVHLQGLFEAALARETGVLDRIGAVYGGVFRGFAAQPALASAVFAEEIFRHDQHLTARVARIMDGIEGRMMTLLRSRKGRTECRTDVPAKDLARVIMGALRFLVTRWRLSGYAFDLEKEGMAMWRSVRTLIAVPVK